MKKLILVLALLCSATRIPAQGSGTSGQSSFGGNILAASTNCTVSQSCVQLFQVAPTTTSISVTVSGTLSGTLIAEVSTDGGYTWSTAPGTFNQTGLSVLALSAITSFRVRCSAYTSGNAGVQIVAAGNQINIGSSSGGTGGNGPAGVGLGSSIFTISNSACNSAANCLQWVDDDSTDNCGTATTSFLTAVNAYSGPGAPQVIISGSGTGKAYKLATCTLTFTRSLGAAVNLLATIDCAQTAVSCIQFGATGQSSIVAGSIYSLYGSGALTNGVNLTTAGIYAEPGVDILNISGITMRGAQGGTTGGGFGANNSTLGNCTNWAIFIDTPFATGAITNTTLGITSNGLTAGGCGIGNPNGGSTGFNTLYITNNTIAAGAFGTACGSQGVVDGGSYGTIRDNTIYGFGVDVRLQGIGHVVDGNDLDSIGCANHGTNATIQFGGASSSTAVIGATISNNKPQVATGHALALFDKAGDSTATIQGITITGNQNVITQSSSPVGNLIGTGFGCTFSTSSSTPCYLAGNENFFGVVPQGTTQAGWSTPVNSIAQQFADLQTANVGTTLVFNAPLTGAYLATCKVVMERVATTSSTLPQCVISWTDQGTGAAESVNVTPVWASGTVGCSGATTNTIGNACYGTQLISSAAGNAINFSTTGYASTGATAMQYIVATILNKLF